MPKAPVVRTSGKVRHKLYQGLGQWRHSHITNPKVTGYNIRNISRLFPQVTKVVDATEPIVAQVSAEDNAKGGVKDVNNCAMARACKRQYDLDGIIISLSTAYTIKGDTATRYQVPQSLAREIVTFDRAKKFEPGTYQLTPFAKGYRIGKGGLSQYTGPHKRKGKKRGPKQVHHLTANVRKFPDRAIHKGEPDVIN